MAITRNVGQGKLASIAEAVVSTAVGLGIAVVATEVITWAYDIPLTIENNLKLTCWMTVLSVIRSYVIRRFFNRRTIK